MLMRRPFERFALLFGVVSVTLLSVAVMTGAASGTTVIGQTVVPDHLTGAVGNIVFNSSVASANAYVVPTGTWTLTSWSAHGGTVGGPAALRVLRPAGGSYVVVGASPMEDLVPGIVNTYPVSIAVTGGDILGIAGGTPSGGGSSADLGAFTNDTGDTWVIVNDGAVGSTVPVLDSGDSYLFNISATLEQATPAAPTHRGGYCSVAGNINADTGKPIAPGTFLNLSQEQVVAKDPHYLGVLPANYLQGLGITCDVLPGYVKTDQTVGYRGAGDPGGYIYYKKS
jgi:hypothetical protein